MLQPSTKNADLFVPGHLYTVLVKPLQLKQSYSVTFSPDSTLLATLARDVVLWEVASFQKKFRTHPLSHPSHMCFSPTGEKLAIKGTSGQIVIIDTSTGKELCAFGNYKDGEGANLRYSPCGNYLVDGSWDGRLFVRRADTGQVEFTADFPEEMITGVHSTMDGAMWVIAHSVKATNWDLPPEPGYFSVWSWPFRPNSYSIFPRRIPFESNAAVSPDGNLLAVVSGAPIDTLALYRMENGAEVGSVLFQAGGTGGALSWSPNGRLLGLVQNNEVVIYDIASLKPINTVLLPYASDIAFPSQGNLLAIGSWEAGCVFHFDELNGTVSLK